MKKKLKKAIASRFFPVTIFACIIMGCGSAGHVFNYQNRQQLTLNRTNVEEALANIGKPTTTKSVSNTDGSYKILTYVYAHAVAGASSSSRVLLLEFKNDKLNAMVYNSGFEGDETDFDVMNVEKIIEGKSTKNDVVQLMGTPPGKALCPTTVYDFHKYTDTDEIWSWEYTKKSRAVRNASIETEVLILYFNKAGIVIGKDYSSSK